MTEGKEMSREYASVHDAHCCRIHGCKYGKLHCPVEAGEELGLTGTIGCESCETDMAEHAKDLALIRAALEAAAKEMDGMFGNDYGHEIPGAAIRHLDPQSILDEYRRGKHG